MNRKFILKTILNKCSCSFFNELENLTRASEANPNKEGFIYRNDTFVVDEEHSKILCGENENGLKVCEIVCILNNDEVADEINEEEVQAVANAIVEEAEEQGKSVEEVVNEIVEESQDDVEKDILNMFLNEEEEEIKHDSKKKSSKK
jgi:hypothetical protein